VKQGEARRWTKLRYVRANYHLLLADGCCNNDHPHSSQFVFVHRVLIAVNVIIISGVHRHKGQRTGTRHHLQAYVSQLM
jgi:hypothetical protein